MRSWLTVRASWVIPLGLALCGPLACGQASQRPPPVDDGGLPSIDATGGPDSAADPDAPGTMGGDPGLAPLRRLTDLEYENTIKELLGVAGLPSQPRLPLEPVDTEFDNNASGQSLSPQRFGVYLDLAWALADQVMADATLRVRVLTCVPSAGPADDGCLRGIVSAFGRRAWRRPLEPSEIDDLTALGRQAMVDGDDATDAVKRIVVALLTSESFLFRVEFDPGRDPTAPHAVTPYELASRLSYLLWSSMPDDLLFALADGDGLASPEALTAQVDRMLQDRRAAGFVRGFAAQWLGFRALRQHEVTFEVFRGWSDPIRQGMIDEATLFSSEVLLHDRDIRDLLIADVNFVNHALAPLYGFGQTDGDALVRVQNATDERIGYLGLLAFLTATSFPEQTSATRRGRFIMEQLLCRAAVEPAAGTPAQPMGPGGVVPDPGNARQRYADASSNVACLPCHQQTDPLGLGLENFDAAGVFRTTYPSGVEIDPRGALLDGTPFQGLRQLASLLAGDPAYPACVAQKTLTYALGRALVDTDRDALTAVQRTDAHTMRAILTAIVTSDLFRLRRGEP